MLEAAFEKIAETRMAGVPILNPALTVETVGFRCHEGRWQGVLITPWFMNLLAMPNAEDDWQDVSSGSTKDLTLPSGDVAFMHAWEESVGPYLSHSLYSPMQDFADQDYARSVAEEVLKLLYAPAAESEQAAAAPEKPGGLTAKLDKSVSRRGFLSAFLPSDGPP